MVRNAKSGAGKVVQYYSIDCPKCRWELKFGQHIEGDTLFAKGWEAPFQGGGGGGGRSEPPPQDDDSDIPF